MEERWEGGDSLETLELQYTPPMPPKTVGGIAKSGAFR